MAFQKLISRRLDSIGDGTGEINATGDYSRQPQSFSLAPGPNQTVIIARLIVGIGDSGTLDAGFYGNNTELTEGIQVGVYTGPDLSFALTDPRAPIRTNAHWAFYCHDLTYHSWGSGMNYATARWTFVKTEQPLELEGVHHDRLSVTLNDDFRSLAEHSFLVQGYILERQ